MVRGRPPNHAQARFPHLRCLALLDQAFPRLAVPASPFAKLSFFLEVRGWDVANLRDGLRALTARAADLEAQVQKGSGT